MLWNVLIVDPEGNYDQINESPFTLDDLAEFLDGLDEKIASILLFPVRSD
jgi:hypothetical protein